MAKPPLRWFAVVIARTIAIMSGILSLSRELYALLSGKAPTASTFWVCVWIAFGVSAFLTWLQEHQSISVEREARERAEAALKDQSPKLYLEYSPAHAADFLRYSGLLVRNTGRKAAFKTNLSCDPSAKVRLSFEEMPIQKIDPDKGESVQTRTEYLNDNGLWYPVGGTYGQQIESCFERLNEAGAEEAIAVEIKYTDYEGHEYMTACVIRRDGNLFLTKRIWCELNSGSVRKTDRRAV